MILHLILTSTKQYAPFWQKVLIELQDHIQDFPVSETL
jgi:hypothetical protein